jgi:ribA/ribD-fused uncharacterized protein
MSRPVDEIIDFRGHFRGLSNFSPHSATIYGWTFPNGEAAFHAQKHSDFDYWTKLTDASPQEAKRLGRTIPLNVAEWDVARIDAMKLVVAAKTMQHEEIRQLLLDTDDAILIENNTWHDQFWGSCECPGHRSIVGRNALGRIWMLQRDYWTGAL